MSMSSRTVQSVQGWTGKSVPIRTPAVEVAQDRKSLKLKELPPSCFQVTSDDRENKSVPRKNTGKLRDFT